MQGFRKNIVRIETTIILRGLLYLASYQIKTVADETRWSAPKNGPGSDRSPHEKVEFMPLAFPYELISFGST